MILSPELFLQRLQVTLQSREKRVFHFVLIRLWIRLGADRGKIHFVAWLHPEFLDI